MSPSQTAYITFLSIYLLGLAMALPIIGMQHNNLALDRGLETATEATLMSLGWVYAVGNAMTIVFALRLRSAGRSVAWAVLGLIPVINIIAFVKAASYPEDW